MDFELPDISGVVPVLPTPFNADESVDEKGYKKLLEFAATAGCHSVVLPAFGSEFYKLTAGERTRILDRAFSVSGEINIIVQCNHISPTVVQELVKDAEKRGALAINTALPRMMPVDEDQLLQYAGIVCNSTRLPVIIQDYNPGSTIVGLPFAKRLHEECANFRFIKFEVPGIGPLIRDIFDATSGRVKVFSGWGGLYMLEQIPANIAGIMPGLPLADYFNGLWNNAASGNMSTALDMYAGILPYLSFSLQNLEMFHHAEKRLAVRRGILRSAVVRKTTTSPDRYQEKYLEMLLDHTCATIERFGLNIKAL